MPAEVLDQPAAREKVGHREHLPSGICEATIDEVASVWIVLNIEQPVVPCIRDAVATEMSKNMDVQEPEPSEEGELGADS